jgi:outer membrane biosynthesis protein TonB
MSAPEPSKIDNLVGQVIDGRYRISRQIAVGGMGVVYEAKHAKIGRSVAVKVLHREMAGDSEVVGRFLNEARAMGTIGHPNIVACTDFGELPGNLPYLVLEYLEGCTLGDEIAKSGPMEVPRALRLAVQVASALEAAHSRGVIHRDLTSGNVFLTKAEGDWENAKVLDFGISKFLTATEASPKTRRGFTMGTPEFMAPEQIPHPDVVAARADVYALGVIMYHMLAGKTPFGGAGVQVQTLFLQVVNELPPHIDREDIPAEVLALLDKALAKDPYDRFPDMRTMGAALELLAPAPVMSGTYSGRVDAMPTGAGTGSRPIPKFTTRQVGPKSGVYAAATRTSLVEMAAAKAGGTEAAPKSRKPLILGAVGLVAAVAVIAVLAGKGQKASPPATAPVAAERPSAGPETARPAPTGPVKLEVASSTPSARVMFRGHAHSIPFSDTVAADSKLEVVEVTAPGREGRRYWLTIDHPMKLSVDLPQGRGIIEATTEEALVALGEREAEPVAPGATPVADNVGGKHATHRTPSRSKVAIAAPSPSASAAAARKGAPSASAPSPSEPAPAPVAVKAPEPVAAPAPPPPVETPPPPPPAPVAVKPQPAPAKPTPAPAPAHPATPAAAPAHPVVVAPTIDNARAQAVFGEHAPDVQRCHQRAKIDNSDIRGKLTMKISISTSGQVTATNIDASTLHSSALDNCIASAVRTWTFPAAVGGTATISHVFVLR